MLFKAIVSNKDSSWNEAIRLQSRTDQGLYETRHHSHKINWDASVTCLEIITFYYNRGSRIFFWENQNLRPANLFLMPLETRTQKIKKLRLYNNIQAWFAYRFLANFGWGTTVRSPSSGGTPSKIIFWVLVSNGIRNKLAGRRLWFSQQKNSTTPSGLRVDWVWGHLFAHKAQLPYWSVNNDRWRAQHHDKSQL